jgi:hypothetical protein
MADLDDSFDGLRGFAKMPLVATDFDFGHVMPRATFPEDFVHYYKTFAEGDPVDFVNERRFFLANFNEHTEICMYNGLFSPQSIQVQNDIISDSMYVNPGDIVMPPGFYAIGTAYSGDCEMRLMINLRPDSLDYGKIFVWNLAWDALGRGDNTRGLGHVADGLQAFIEGLQPKDAL